MSVQLLIDGKVVHPSPEVVLFDKDGTLIDIHHYWASMIRIRAKLVVEHWFSMHKDNEVIKSQLMDSMGVDLVSGHMKPEGPVGIKPRQFIVSVAAQKVRDHGVNVDDEEMELLFAQVDENTTKNLLPLLRLLPGVETLLRRLQKLGIPAVIVSTDITSRARKAMEVLKLDSYFADIIGADQVNATKPAADLVELALQRTGCTAKGAVVVGDHPVDVKMGSAAGTGLNIGVLTGLSDESAFQALDCRVVPDLNAVEIC